MLSFDKRLIMYDERALTRVHLKLSNLYPSYLMYKMKSTEIYKLHVTLNLG